MIQQTLAVSTAIFFSLSFIPYGTPGTATRDNVTAIVNDSNQKGEEQGSESGETQTTPMKTQGALLAGQGDMARDPKLEPFNLSNCRITQSEDSHHTPEGGHSYALDVACVQGISYEVKAPNYKPYYVLAYIGEDERLGDYVVLRHGEERWIFGHTKATKSVGEKIHPNEAIGQSNDSGHATGIHTHIEYWSGRVNKSLDGKLENAFSGKLCVQREWAFCQKKVKVSAKSAGLQKYYFTHYDLGVVGQNDSSPCHGASGADLCFLAREGVNTMALTADIRNKLGVKWGDKVILEGDAGCRGIYEVHDEMNPRYRVPDGGVKRPGTNYYIKGDLPGKPGGACTVQKIKY